MISYINTSITTLFTPVAGYPPSPHPTASEIDLSQILYLMLLIDVVHSKNFSQLVRRLNGDILVPVVNTSIINSINDHMYN